MHKEASLLRGAEDSSYHQGFGFLTSHSSFPLILAAAHQLSRKQFFLAVISKPKSIPLFHSYHFPLNRALHFFRFRFLLHIIAHVDLLLRSQFHVFLLLNAKLNKLKEID